MSQSVENWSMPQYSAKFSDRHRFNPVTKPKLVRQSTVFERFVSADQMAAMEDLDKEAEAQKKASRRHQLKKKASALAKKLLEALEAKTNARSGQKMA